MATTEITTHSNPPKSKYFSPFLDVTTKTPGYASINCMFHMGIAQGYKTSKGYEMRPLNSATREACAIWIYKSVEGSSSYKPPAKSMYADVSTKSSSYKAIAWTYYKKIAQGISKNGKRYFKPNDAITRSETAVMLFNAYGEKGYKPSKKSPFIDVKYSTSSTYKAICWLAERGISAGWKTKKGKEFRPKSVVTRGDLLIFLHRWQNLLKKQVSPNGTKKYVSDSPYAPNAKGSIKFNNLVAKRFGIAYTSDISREVNKQGWEKWLNAQFALTNTADTQWMAPWIKVLPMINQDIHQATITYKKHMKKDIDSTGRTFAAQQRIGTTVLRGMYSPRVVNEAVTSFWLDHFSLPYTGGGSPAVLGLDLWMRDKALTNVYEILWGVFRSMKMYSFLNADQSVKGKVNENLAREMLELYTTGITTGIEEDIRQLAILLTGHINAWNGNADLVFSDYHHVFTSKPLTILKRQYKNSNTKEALASVERLIYDLTWDKRTISFLSKKLVTHFVNDNPTSSMIKAVEETYRRTNGSVKDMIRTMITHPDFVKKIGSKWRRPFEVSVSQQRSLKPVISLTPEIAEKAKQPITYNPAYGYVNKLSIAGHSLRNSQSPKGNSNLAKDWLNTSSMLHTINIVTTTYSASSTSYRLTSTWEKTLGYKDTGNYSTIANTMFEELTGFTPTTTIRKFIEKILEDKTKSWSTRIDTAATRILASPYNFFT